MNIMILDGNSLLNRAFYGIRTLTNREGVHTNAVYGFLATYSRLFQDAEPDGVAVCFDLKAPTFRHKEFDVYKAGRHPMPEELVCQVPLIKEVLDRMGVPRFELSGYEADDLIGTISRMATDGGHTCVIVTGDRDALQLIDDRVIVKLVTTKAGRPETLTMDTAAFAGQYCGLPPAAMIDLKALSGDKSDNIPGVAGIGDKTALDLLCRFRSIDGIYRNIDSKDIRDSVRNKLKAGEEMARLSYQLAAIDRRVPVAFTPSMAKLRPRQDGPLFDLLMKLELKTFITKFKLTPSSRSAPAEKNGCGPIPFAAVKTAEGLAQILCASKEAPAAALHFSPSFDRLAVVLGPAGYVLVKNDFDDDIWRDFLAHFFSGDIRVIAHDGKPLLRHLLSMGLSPCGPFYDTALAAYLLDPSGPSYDLARAASLYLDFPLLPPGVAMDGDALTLFADDPRDAQGAPDAGDCGDPAFTREAAAVYALYRETELRLKADGMYGLLVEIELPLISVLAGMERAGILVDPEQLGAFGASLNSRIETLTGEIYELAGEPFNINSTKALGVILFEKLGLPTAKKTKTGYSTDIEVLNHLKDLHEIIPKLIEYRQLVKLAGTYVEGLSKVMDEDGRVRTTFQQMVTTTGRLSSTDPNLQNIPIRKSLGSELRRMFVAPPGWVLVDADYSQIELRILAHIARDKAMIEAFLKSEDIHAVTASEVFHVPLGQVTAAQRSASKAVNFGIVYGISEFSLSENLGISRAEAGEYIRRYLEHYAGVREYMEEIKERARADGYVTTLFGRRRYLPELKSANYNIRSFGERAALNTPIQGTAADIIKIAMLRVSRRLEKEKLRTRLLLQVHDELILEAPEEEAPFAMRLLKEEMEAAYPMKAPLVADVSVGKSWFDAK